MAKELSAERQIPLSTDDTCPQRALVILNPVAGQCDPQVVRAILEEGFAAAGWEHRVYETARDEDFRSVVAEAVEEGCDLVVAAGGDGTVALVANHLVGTEVPLAILPLGTGNILARELEIPLDLPNAVATIVGEHRTIALDAMHIDDRYYFLNAGIGLPASVMQDTPREAKRRFGMLAYAGTAVQKLLSYRPTRFRLVVDGEARTVRATFVMVANAGALGTRDFRWSWDAAIDDGVLDVVVARTRSLRDYLVLAWHLWTGKPVGSPVRTYRASRTVGVTSARPLAVQADGESIGSRSLQVRIVPHAVRAIVPMPEPPDGEISPEAAARVTRLQRALRVFLGPLGVVDTSIYIAVNRLPHPIPLNLALRALSAVMSKGMAWAVGLFVASRLDSDRGQRALRGVLPAMWLTGLAIEFPVKRLFSRARPFASLTLITVTGNKPYGYSFPSAHTAVSFAAAWLLRPHYPRLAPAIYALASTVAFARLYLGVHYLSDVLAGVAAGTVLAEVVRRLLDRLGLPGRD